MTRVDSVEPKTVTQPLKLVSVIAEGHSNIVALVQDQETLKYSVAKILTEERRDLVDHLEAEAAIYKDLDHPKILKLESFQKNLAIADAEGNEMLATGLVVEYAPRGDLFDLLTSFNQLPLMLARSYSKQMVEALAYLHGKGIAHLDVKLENFLLDTKFNIKLADFGVSRVTDKEQLLNDQVGTTAYWSPEQNEQTSYNGFEVDVFNLGVTIFLLVAGRMPFETATKDDEYYGHFYNQEEENFWQRHEEEMNPSSSMSFFKEDFKSLINGMLHYNPSERMTIEEVMSHPWLNISPDLVEKCGGIVAEFLKKKGMIN